MEERKIKVDNLEDTEKKIQEIGARFIQTTESVDTYYKQPKGHVLKIVEDDLGNFLVQMHEKEGKFLITRHEKVEKAKELKNALKDTYGRQNIIDKQHRLYEWNNYKLKINSIENVGDFLIVQGETVPETIFQEINIEGEPITIPFSELTKDL